MRLTVSKRRSVAAARIATWLLPAVVFFAGCSTAPPSSYPDVSQGNVDLAGLEPGVIVITSISNATTAIAVDPPNRRAQSISEGAEDATRSFLNTPNLGNPQLEAGVGAVQFVLAPFAAAYGAISASQRRLSPIELSQAQQDLAQTMRTNADPQSLILKVGEIAQQKTRRVLACTGSSSNAPAKGLPVSAVLEVAVERLQLKAAKPGASQYVLAISVSARLHRASDARVLMEHSYHYESGPGLFADWMRQGGLDGAAQTGYQVLAGQITDDVFQPASGPPMLIGPGQRHSRIPSVRCLHCSAAVACSRARPVQTLPGRYGRPCLMPPAFRPQQIHFARAAVLISLFAAGVITEGGDTTQNETNAMEIHTGKTDERIRAPKPGPDSGSGSGTMSDTKWSLDGLEEDRNAIVQGLSCLAAVPMGLWEQSVGLIGKRSRDKTDQFVRALNAVTTREHFEENMADEVARRLQSQVVDSVRRTDEPLRFALSNQPDAGGAGTTQADALAKTKTALEIQVLTTRLVGKHPNSRSRAVLVEIQATVYRTSDGQELYSRPIRYLSSQKRLKDWAASDGKLFRQELNACSQQTAQALAKELIGRGFVNRAQNPSPASVDRLN